MEALIELMGWEDGWDVWLTFLFATVTWRFFMGYSRK